MVKRQKRVFILGGGAALGAHHVGALKLLEERGIVPDTIIGSSIGCINACCYGSGGVARLEMAWEEVSRSGEGRVGEEGRSPWAADHLKKKKKHETRLV